MADLPEILCLDDHEDFLAYVARHLSAAGYQVVTCAHWKEAADLLKRKRIHPDVVLVDPLTVNGSPVSIEEVSQAVGQIPIIAVSASRDPQVIAGAIRQGARDYLTKPFSAEELRRAVELVVGSDTRPKSRSEGVRAKVEFIYRSPVMAEVERTALRVAKVHVPVLITGETGVGKDVVARFIHQNSPLADRPFVKVNCAAMPAELVESELFGYRKGAFTGAYIDRPGKFEFANEGTIFLDEIAEFTPSVQAKLLQVLQDGQFSRLGSNEEVQVNVRVVAATNRHLETAIREGKFREDLYYRLNVVNINISPLRHRREDIPAFCEYFLKNFSQQYGLEAPQIPDSLMETFLAFDWPGNVRELENLVKRYVVLQEPQAIVQELKHRMAVGRAAEIESLAEAAASEEPGGNSDLKEAARRAVEQVERRVILRTLLNTGWNKSQAARELGVSYKTLLNKIEQYQIRPGDRP